MKKFFTEFKEFIAKGNVMTMAVGIVIGAAFTSIVTSLVNDIITPLIGILIGGIDFTGIAITIGASSLMFGNFIQAIINFLLTAFVLFLVVRTFNKLDALKKKEEEKQAAPPEPSDEVKLLTEIRDLLKK